MMPRLPCRKGSVSHRPYRMHPSETSRPRRSVHLRYLLLYKTLKVIVVCRHLVVFEDCLLNIENAGKECFDVETTSGP